MKIQNNVRGKLLLVETLILAIPILTLSYVFFKSGYAFEFLHLILSAMVLLLILAGLIIVREIFDKISSVATSLKKIENGDSVIIDAKKGVTELSDISNTVNNLVEKLKKVEVSLNESEERHHQLFEMISDAIFLIDNETGNILEVNQAASDLYGFTRNLFLMMKHTDVSAEPEETRRVTLAAEAYIPVRWHRKKDGAVFPVEISARHFVWEGRPVHIAAIRDITERIQAEEALRTTEERLRSLIDHNPDAVYSFDINGTFLTMNESGSRITGYSEEEFKQMNFGQLIVTEDAENVRRYFEKASKGEPQYYETTIICKDGRRAEINVTNTPIIVNDEIVGVYGIAKDISERKRIEQELIQARKEWEHIFQAIGNGAVILNPEHSIIAANQAILASSGMTEKEIRGKQCYEIFHGKNTTAPPDKCPMEKMLATGKTETAPMEVEAFGGIFLVSCTPLYDKWGKIEKIIHITTDITDRKKMEEELRDSERKYRFITEKITDVVWIMDLNLRTLYVSPSIEKLLGFTPEERARQDVKEQLTPESLSVAFDTLAKELILEQQGEADPERVVTLEVEYYHKDGSTRWVENIISGIRDDRGILTGFHGVSRDIARRKLAEKDLERAKDQLLQSEKLAALGQLSAGVAHEILNPLNIISMELQMLQAMKDLSPEVQEELTVCMSQIKRIVVISESLKQVSRITEKKMSIVDINNLIATVLNLYKTPFLKDRIVVEERYHDNLPKIAIDKEKIEQVMMNLISNATSFMEGKDKRVLRITTDLLPTVEGHDQLMIMVSDTGIGIKSKYMAKIFEPFFTTKEQGAGTGLGLSISHAIIRDHNGRIWAENNEWGGASFYITLPVNSSEFADKI